MTDTIAPVFTPDEWAIRPWVIRDGASEGDEPRYAPGGHRRGGGALLSDGGVLVVAYDSGVMWQPIRSTPERIAAIALDALPGDSPYKITREDVVALSVVLHEGEISMYTSPADHPRNAAMLRVQQLREKLAALLPPVGLP